MANSNIFNICSHICTDLYSIVCNITDDITPLHPQQEIKNCWSCTSALSGWCSYSSIQLSVTVWKKFNAGQYCTFFRRNQIKSIKSKKLHLLDKSENVKRKEIYTYLHFTIFSLISFSLISQTKLWKNSNFVQTRLSV